MPSAQDLYNAHETLRGATSADRGWTVEAISYGTPIEALGIARGTSGRARAIIGFSPKLSVADLRDLLRIDWPSSPSLLHVGPLDAPQHSSLHLVVEELVAGTSLRSWWVDRPRDPRGLVAVAEHVALWHARGLVVDGLDPELIYVERPVGRDDEPCVTAFVPRAARFWRARTPGDSYQAKCLELYGSPQVLERESATAADDVFTLAAIAWHHLLGIHPFGRGWNEQMIGIVGGLPPTGDLPTVAREGLVEVLTAALERRRDARPTAAEVAEALRQTR